jgi:arylsulfatase A-like enzyme
MAQLGRAWVSLMVAILATAAPARAAAPKADIVILVSVDDWRPDTIGAYGSTKALTPHFDDLARHSTLFLRAYSAASWTRPSHMSMISSLLPSDQSPIFYNGRLEHDGPEAQALPSFYVTLPQALSRRGFETGGFVAHHNLDGRYGFSRGFDVYELRQHALGSTQTERALNWLSGRKKGRKIFLFLHYYDIHMANDFKPFHPEYRMYHCETPAAQAVLKEAATTYFWTDATHDNFITDLGPPKPSPEHVTVMKIQYASCVASLDAELGVFISGLKKLGLYDDALMVVTSDHGEAFGENHRFTHGGRPTPTLLHVPLLLKAPRQREASRFSGLVSLLDIMPTVLASAAPGEAKRLSRQMEGRSLWDVLQTGAGEKAVFAEEPWGPQRGVVSEDGWELIESAWKGDLNLFRLDGADDPPQNTPEAEAEKKKLQALIDERFRDYPGY